MNAYLSMAAAPTSIPPGCQKEGKNSRLMSVGQKKKSQQNFLCKQVFLKVSKQIEPLAIFQSETEHKYMVFDSWTGKKESFQDMRSNTV